MYNIALFNIIDELRSIPNISQAHHKAIDSLLQSQSFELQAHFLENHWTGGTSVSPTENFVSVDSPIAVLQRGRINVYWLYYFNEPNTEYFMHNFPLSPYVDGFSNNGYSRENGYKAEGTISNYKIEKDIKKLSFTVRFRVSTNRYCYNVLMTINANNSARAKIRGFIGIDES